MEIRTDYARWSDLLKALAHPVRREIIHSLLKRGCHNVSCMERHTGMSQSCISQHLQKLRAVGLVSAERSGNEVYYHASSKEAATLVAVLMGEELKDYVL